MIVRMLKRNKCLYLNGIMYYYYYYVMDTTQLQNSINRPGEFDNVNIQFLSSKQLFKC